MKKKLLIIYLAIYSLALNAQITITSPNNIFVASNSYVTVTDDSVTSYGAAGANQIWDFSSWVTNSELDTVLFQTPSSLFGASFFPTANLGVGSNTGASFFKKSSTAIEFIGFYESNFSGSGDSVVVNYNPPFKFLTFPSAYQTAFNGTASYSIIYPSSQAGYDSIKFDVSQTYSSNIDAWGTLTTPAYSNISTLRQHVTEITNSQAYFLATGDSVWIPYFASIDTSYSYRWWSDTFEHTLAEVSFSPGDTLYYGYYLTSTLVGVNELDKKSTNISTYPSPASDKVTFKGVDSDAYLIIFDVNGKLVDKSLLKRNATISVSNYNNGIYLYNIVPINGTAVSKGKFVVEK